MTALFSTGEKGQDEKNPDPLSLSRAKMHRDVAKGTLSELEVVGSRQYLERAEFERRYFDPGALSRRARTIAQVGTIGAEATTASNGLIFSCLRS